MILAKNPSYNMSNASANLQFMMNYIKFSNPDYEYKQSRPSTKIPNLWGNVWGFVMEDEAAVMEDVI